MEIIIRIAAALVSGAIGAFFGSVSGLPGQIAGGISGAVAGYLYTVKMRSIVNENNYLGKGLMYGMLAGLVSGFIAHIPRTVIDCFIKIPVAGESGFFSGGWSLIVTGTVFGIFVGLVFGLILSVVLREFPAKSNGVKK